MGFSKPSWERFLRCEGRVREAVTDMVVQEAGAGGVSGESARDDSVRALRRSTPTVTHRRAHLLRCSDIQKAYQAELRELQTLIQNQATLADVQAVAAAADRLDGVLDSLQFDLVRGAVWRSGDLACSQTACGN